MPGSGRACNACRPVLVCAGASGGPPTVPRVRPDFWSGEYVQWRLHVHSEGRDGSCRAVRVRVHRSGDRRRSDEEPDHVVCGVANLLNGPNLPGGQLSGLLSNLKQLAQRSGAAESLTPIGCRGGRNPCPPRPAQATCPPASPARRHRPLRAPGRPRPRPRRRRRHRAGAARPAASRGRPERPARSASAAR